MKSFFKIVFFVDLIFIIVNWKDARFLLNSQLAFIASLLIVLGSFYGYKKMVQKKAKSFDGKDIIDEMEDPYDLEEIHDAKKLFEEEKAKVKKMGLKEALKAAPAFFSHYRLFGYLFLVVVVLMLLRKGLFEPLAFLGGLAIVPLSVLMYALKKG